MADSCVVLAGALPVELAGILELGRGQGKGRRAFRETRVKGVKFYTGGIHGKDVAVFVSGVGGARAYETAKTACGVLPVKAYISVGLSAALKPELRPGDVVVGIKTASMSEAGGYESSRELSQLAMGALIGYGTCVFGPLITADRVLVGAEEKRSIALTPQSPQPPFDNGGQGGISVALDMESFGAAKGAGEAGVPFLAIRAISDTLDEDLPVDFNRFMKDGGMDLPRFLLHVLTHPGAIPGLIRLGRNSRLAARNLAGAVERVLSSI